jgi:hypothetical protein
MQKPKIILTTLFVAIIFVFLFLTAPITQASSGTVAVTGSWTKPDCISADCGVAETCGGYSKDPGDYYTGLDNGGDYSFSDPVPKGKIAISADATVYGGNGGTFAPYNCPIPTVIVTLNGSALITGSFSDNGACTGVLHSITNSGITLNNYHSGGTNDLHVQMAGGDACINSVQLIIHYVDCVKASDCGSAGKECEVDSNGIMDLVPYTWTCDASNSCQKNLDTPDEKHCIDGWADDATTQVIDEPNNTEEVGADWVYRTCNDPGDGTATCNESENP